MKKLLLSASVSLALATWGTTTVAQEERFDIQRFEVTGNTLLPDAQLKTMLAKHAGPQRNYGDVQHALEDLEEAYRRLGYSTVQVEVPEQELTAGVVKLNVLEVKIGKIIVTENKYFSEENVLRALPSLKVGQTPNLRSMSENVQLSNENGAKQIEVTLGVGEVDDTVDAKIKVNDKSPHNFGLTVDNTGSESSGKWRTGASYQFANLFDRDQSASFAYTTSPDSPEGVKINNFSLGYRLPLYAWGDSIDIIYGKSSSNTPSSTPNLGGSLNIVGKGDVFSLKLNHNFPRDGETTRKLVAALDYKFIDSRCSTVDGKDVSIEPPTPPLASCVPFKVLPLGLTYSQSTRSGTAQFDYSIGASMNVPLGTVYTNITGRMDRYSYLTAGNRDTKDRFVILRGSASYLKGFENDWQVRLAMSGQYAFNPTVSSEGFGLTGSNTVRGFIERAGSADSGVVANAELYTFDMAVAAGWNGSLRALAFLDASYGTNQNPGPVVPGHLNFASAGLGLRAAIGKQTSIRLDAGRVLHAGSLPNVKNGDYKAHVFVVVSF